MHARLRLGEALRMFAAFHARPADPRELLRTYGLESKERAPFGRLSGGEKRRFLTALAFVGSPRAVILDEPTTGLDPQARHNVWAALERYRDQGGTVFLTTHLLEEAQEHCDRVAIVDHGRLLADGPPARLLRERGLEIRVTLPLDDWLVDVAWGRLGATHQERLDRRWVVYGPDEAFLARVHEEARAHGVALSRLETRGVRLEDLFLLLTLGLTLLVVGVAGPQWGRDWTQSTARGRDLVIVLDMSRSMLAESKSRLRGSCAGAPSGPRTRRLGLVALSARFT